jgi:predicted O-linked N-acetylglucosamine transferase (SPINDLY family)
VTPPTVAEALNAALAHHRGGRLAEARDLYTAVLKVSPNNFDALHLLGVLARNEGDVPAAIRLISRALAVDPRFAAAYSNLGNALQDDGRIAEAIDAHRTALTLDPGDSGAHRRLLGCLLYLPGIGPQERFAAHLDFAVRHRPAPEHVLPPPDNDRDPDRILRVGLLSSDFRAHSTGRNMISLFRWRDRTACQLFCYAEVAAPDSYSEMIRAQCDGWRSMVGLDDRAVAELIRRDRIDLLAVIASHFDANRPLVACYRPAPLQISMLDGATSGLRELDYFVSDPFLTPASSTERFTERLAQLPVAVQCPALESAPAVGALPAAASGFITFGSFNNPAKLSSLTLELWSRVLHAVPGARMMLKYREHFADPILRARLHASFAAHGVDPARIRFLSSDDDQTAHLASYGAIDIALDTTPFTGAHTTFDALWMGVPIITLAGDSVMSRMSSGLLSAAGLDAMIAASPDGFVECATALANDLDRLGRLRAGLRDQVARSPLCDGPAYARSVENLWRSLWRSWCAAPETG